MKDLQIEIAFKDLKIEGNSFLAVAAGWEKSVLSFPKTNPHFMKREFYEKYYAMTGAEDNLVPLMDQVAAMVESSPAMQLFAWHCHNALCFYDIRRFDDWPELDTYFGNNCGMFYLMIWLSAIPEWIKTYRRMGIPEEYAKAAAQGLKGAIHICKSAHNGYPGLDRKQLHWCRWYIEGCVFRIGRFEYMHSKLNKNYPVIYKHKETKQIVAMCNSGWLLDENGFRLYEDQAKEDALLISKLLENQQDTCGTPISPNGHALTNTQIRLLSSEWEKVLSDEDYALEVHIPGGGKMTLDACGESFKDAGKFYRRYFPDKKVKAVFSVSWIFNPNLEEELPKSNLAGFMKQLYLFPWQSSGREGMFFIFGRECDDWRNYPADNSVRQAMLNILKSDRRLKNGGMFYLAEHVNRFGEEYYRNGFNLSQNIEIPKGI